MLSHNQIKHITELRIRKYRTGSGRFVAEGHKLVVEMVESPFTVEAVYALPEWTGEYGDWVAGKGIPVFEIPLRDMERITALTTPSPVLSVVKIPTRSDDHPWFHPHDNRHQLMLALDDIRDPGNLGTIIRIADWFGIGTILCSENCVDTYNPKVIQATMGSIARVRVISRDLSSALAELPADVAVFGALLEGRSLYDQQLPTDGVIVIGNESRGIDPSLMKYITHPVMIPSYGTPEFGKAESLNASVAAAVLCAEFRRKAIV